MFPKSDSLPFKPEEGLCCRISNFCHLIVHFMENDFLKGVELFLVGNIFLIYFLEETGNQNIFFIIGNAWQGIFFKTSLLCSVFIRPLKQASGQNSYSEGV